MFDPRNNLSNEVSSQLIAHFGDKVFRTIVPRNVRLAEAPSFGKPVLQHDEGFARRAGLPRRWPARCCARTTTRPTSPKSRRRPTAAADGEAPARVEGMGSGSIFRSPRKWCLTPFSMHLRHEPRRNRSCGRGLEALLGQMSNRPAPERPGARASPPAPAKLPGDELANLPLDLLQRGKYQPRVRHAPGIARRAGGIDQVAGHHPAHRRARRRWRRTGRIAALRNHRRRTPLARRADRRACHRSGGHPPRAR